MNLAYYWKLTISSWRLIGVCALAGLFAAAAYAFSTTPQFTATASVYVYVSGGDSTQQLAQGSTFAQNQVRSYALLAGQPVVLEPVIQELGLSTTATELAKTVTTNVPLDTVVLEISTTNPSAEEAAATANAIAKQMGVAISTFTPATSPGAKETSIQTSVIASAPVPPFPSSPNKKRDIAGGLLLGLVFCVGVAVIKELTNTRVRSQEIVREITEFPVVGDVLDDSSTLSQPLASQEQDDPRSEAFRKFAANFEFLCYNKSVKTMIITSPMHNEGKSVTAVNLAYVMAFSSRVILVDADLRDPSISELLDLENDRGLTTVLTGRDRLDDSIQPTTMPNLSVLTSGAAPPNSAELLSSADMTDLLAQLSQRCDLVVIDTPPVLPASDAPALARLVDAVLVIANAKKTKREQLLNTLEQLSLAGGRVLGIVLNQTNAKERRLDSGTRISR
jgi:succinoglycan biosynthesis transport protein ExoP